MLSMPSIPVGVAGVPRPPAETWHRERRGGRSASRTLVLDPQMLIVSTGGDPSPCSIWGVLYAAFSGAVLYFARALNA